MLPSIIDPNLPRWLRDIVGRAMDLPHVSQVLDYIEVKCRLRRREFCKRMRLAELCDGNAYFALMRYVHRSGVRNAWDVSGRFLRYSDSASDDEMLDWLKYAEFETGHAAMEMTQRLGKLRAQLQEARAAMTAHTEARDDYYRALRLERECKLLKGKHRREAKSKS